MYDYSMYEYLSNGKITPVNYNCQLNQLKKAVHPGSLFLF